MEVHAAPAGAARPLALDAPTLCHAFQHTAAQRPDDVALRNPGDAVGLMLLNRPEFHLLDTAALHLGATPFSVYNTSTPEQVAHQFANAGNRVVVTECHFLPTVRAARVLVPAVDHVVL